MKVTVITPTYNSEKTILDTVHSVKKQKFHSIEHVVIDGKSSDSTIELIEKEKNIFYISEPDEGIYDAMNKGVRKAKGDIIIILNSDDFFIHEQVISQVVRIFDQTQADMVYGDIAIVDGNNIKKLTRYWRAGRFNKWKLQFGWIFPHPAVFVKKELYEKVGTFDDTFYIAADYDFLLRIALRSDVTVSYLPEAITCMREGGFSSSSMVQREKGWKEICEAWQKNTGKKGGLLILFRIFHKLPQYIFPKLQFYWFNKRKNFFGLL